MSLARTREVLARLALVIAGTIVALLIGEVALRVLDPLKLRVRGHEILLPRAVRFVFEDVRLRGVSTRVVHTKNRLGFRGADPPPDFTSRLTIFAVGGSTTECFFLSDGEDWPAVLGQRLQTFLPRVWMNNAGLDGHSTFGHERLLAQHILPLRPRVVLLLVGANDVGRQDLGELERESEGVRARRFRLDHLAASSYLLASAVSLRRSLAARRMGLIHRDLDLRQLPVPALEPHRTLAAVQAERPLLEGFRQRLERLIALCTAARTEVILITQPSLLGRGIDPATGVDLERVELQPGLNGATQWAVLESYNDVTRRVGRQQGALVVDLAAQLPKSSQYFYDGLHFSREGAAAVGELLATQIRPSLQERFPGS